MVNREQILFISYKRVINRNQFVDLNEQWQIKRSAPGYTDTFYQDRTLSIKVLKCLHEFFQNKTLYVFPHAQKFENVTIVYFLFTQQIMHYGI